MKGRDSGERFLGDKQTTREAREEKKHEEEDTRENSSSLERNEREDPETGQEESQRPQ